MMCDERNPNAPYPQAHPNPHPRAKYDESPTFLGCES